MLANNNVKHILYSSMWFSESPFLTSTQTQQAWAYENNVVLIAAGANNPKKGSTGSGIYVGRHGALDIIFSPERKRFLMVQQVPKDLETFHGKIINYNKVSLEGSQRLK
jgi:pantetheine hydrolase